MTRLPIVAYCLLFAVLHSACKNGQNKPSKDKTDSIAIKQKEIQDASIPGGFSSQTILHFDSNALTGFVSRYPAFKKFENDLKSFYRQRNYAYAWYDSKGLIEQAGNLYNRIVNINDEGLPDKFAYRDSFTVVMDSLQGMTNNIAPNTSAELMLTAQYFSYAQIAWQGLSEEESRSLEWNLPRRKVNLVQLMDSLLYDGDAFVAKEPVYRQYALLKNYLKKYRDIEASGGWTNITPDKKKYAIGDSSSVIATLRQRLFQLGDIPEDNKSVVFDTSMLNGIKAFQQRLGIKQDGIVGASFFTEINYPIGKRIEQVIVNMERCRWLPAEPSVPYLAVNIPEFALHAYNGDSLLWSMEVVVGKAVHETVIFSGQLKYVVFSPYWNVPPGILKNEVLPGMKRNPNYLRNHNMEWNGGAVRQKPGPSNSLGLVKFLFPNSYNIYLHDSPAKSLFQEDKRAFSHGCIRVSRPKDLAKWLLRDYPEWTDDKITKAMNGGKEQYFTLKETVPVFIAYFTAWVDREGKLNFRDDIYKRDNRLAKAIMEQPRI